MAYGVRLKAKEIEKLKINNAGKIHPSDEAISLFESSIFLFRHPGDFRAVFSLPLNAPIRGPWYLKVCGFPLPRHPGNF